MFCNIGDRGDEIHAKISNAGIFKRFQARAEILGEIKKKRMTNTGRGQFKNPPIQRKDSPNLKDIQCLRFH